MVDAELKNYRGTSLLRKLTYVNCFIFSGVP